MPKPSSTLEQVAAAWNKITRRRNSSSDLEFRLTYEVVLRVIAREFEEFCDPASLFSSSRLYDTFKNKIIALDESLHDTMVEFVTDGRKQTGVDIPFLNKVRRIHALKGLVEDVMEALQARDVLTIKNLIFVIDDLSRCFETIWGVGMTKEDKFYCLLVIYLETWVKYDDDGNKSYPGLPKVMWL